MAKKFAGDEPVPRAEMFAMINPEQGLNRSS